MICSIVNILLVCGLLFMNGLTCVEEMSLSVAYPFSRIKPKTCRASVSLLFLGSAL